MQLGILKSIIDAPVMNPSYRRNQFIVAIDDRSHSVAVDLWVQTDQNLKAVVIDSQSTISPDAVDGLIKSIKAVFGEYNQTIYYNRHQVDPRTNNDLDSQNRWAIPQTQKYACYIFAADNAYRMGKKADLYEQLEAIYAKSHHLSEAASDENFMLKEIHELPLSFLRLSQRRTEKLIEHPDAEIVVVNNKGETFKKAIESRSKEIPKNEKSISFNDALEQKRKKWIQKLADASNKRTADINNAIKTVFCLDMASNLSAKECESIVLNSGSTLILNIEKDDHWILTINSTNSMYRYRVDHTKDDIRGTMREHIFVNHSFIDDTIRKQLGQATTGHAEMQTSIWLEAGDGIAIHSHFDNRESSGNVHSVSYEKLKKNLKEYDPCPNSISISGSLDHLKAYISKLINFAQNNPDELMRQGCRQPLAVQMIMRTANLKIEKTLEAKKPPKMVPMDYINHLAPCDKVMAMHHF